MTQRWTLDTIDWSQFDASKVSPDLLVVAKTAALVEANSADYVTYLKNVFPGDTAFAEAAEQWGVEERLHGEALGKWAELADPGFSFEGSLAMFRDGYSIPLDAEESIRGSRAGELIARQVVESGTSSFYSAIRDASEEPVLKEIARRIAIDEFMHYQLFAKHFKRYRDAEPLGRLAKLKIAVSRVQEAEDDELAYAYHAANVLPGNPDAPYRPAECTQDYWLKAMSLYRRQHIENATKMILRAADVRPHGLLGRAAASSFWTFVRLRRSWMERRTA